MFRLVAASISAAVVLTATSSLGVAVACRAPARPQATVYFGPFIEEHARRSVRWNGCVKSILAAAAPVASSSADWATVAPPRALLDILDAALVDDAIFTA